MSQHSFILTYSVSPYSAGAQVGKIANKVRADIAAMKIWDWKKLRDVETTFAGTLELTGFGVAEKREEALQLIAGQIECMLRLAEGFHEVWVHVALQVDGVGGHQEFSV